VKKKKILAKRRLMKKEKLPGPEKGPGICWGYFCTVLFTKERKGDKRKGGEEKKIMKLLGTYRNNIESCPIQGKKAGHGRGPKSGPQTKASRRGRRNSHERGELIF